MMTAILNTAILNLAIFDSSILVCPLKLTHTCQDWFPPFEQKNFTHFFWLNLMIAAILNSANLNSTILDSTILVFPLKLTHTCQDWFPTFTQKILHSFILTQLDDGSHLEFGNLGFNHLSFSSQTHSHLPRLVPTILHKKTSLIHSDSTWWWQPSWIPPCWIQILPSWIQTPIYLLSDSLKNTLTPLWLWLQLIQSDSKSFILTQLDDSSHLEFCHLEFDHLWFNHLSFPCQTHSHLPRLVPNICTKELHSFILTQLDDGSHLEFCQLEFHHLGFNHISFPLKLTHTCQDWFPTFYTKNTSLIHSDSTWWWQPSWILAICGFRHLVIFSQIHSKLAFSTLTLTQTNSIFKLIHSDSTWWWHPSWILPSSIQHFEPY